MRLEFRFPWRTWALPLAVKWHNGKWATGDRHESDPVRWLTIHFLCFAVTTHAEPQTACHFCGKPLEGGRCLCQAE